MLTLTHTAGVVNDVKAPAINNNVGVSVWVNDLDGSFLYFPLKDDLTETKPSDSTVTGYTYSHIEISNPYVLLNNDTELNLPNYGYMSVSEILNHTDLDTKIFCEVLKDISNNIQGIKKLLVYSEAPTNQCLAKTLRYY